MVMRADINNSKKTPRILEEEKEMVKRLKSRKKNEKLVMSLERMRSIRGINDSGKNNNNINILLLIIN